MGRRAIRLSEYFEKYAKGRGVMMADKLAIELRRVLSVQAPTRMTRSGKTVAATPATPLHRLGVSPASCKAASR